MKKYIIILILLSISQSVIAENSNYKFKIELSKQKYLLMEPIWLDVTLTNISPDTIRMPSICLECQDSSLTFELLDDSGKSYKYSGDVWSIAYSSTNGYLYGHNEGIFKCFNLLETNGINDHGLIGALWLNHLPVGLYSIRVYFYGGCSEKLNFEIVEPEGSSKQEYNELLNAYLSRKEHDIEYVYEELNKFIEKYPNSIYIEKAYWDRHEYKKIFKKFPNSGYNRINLSYILNNLTSKEKQEFLQKIILNNPNSRSAKYAKQILNKQKLKKKEE